MHAMKAFVLSQPVGRTTAKLVEANELLFIAAETYQKSSSFSNMPNSDLHDVSTTHNLCKDDEDDDEDEGAKEQEEPAAHSGYQPQCHSTVQKQSQHEPHTPMRSRLGGGGNGSETNKAKLSAISFPAPVAAAMSGESNDVQKRLGSLLERMKRRQQQPDE